MADAFLQMHHVVLEWKQFRTLSKSPFIIYLVFGAYIVFGFVSYAPGLFLQAGNFNREEERVLNQ